MLSSAFTAESLDRVTGSSQGGNRRLKLGLLDEQVVGVERRDGEHADALRGAVPSLAPLAPAASASLFHFLPHAIDIALLAAPDVAAGRLLTAEAATPIYLRDNVVHVTQPPKAPATSP